MESEIITAAITFKTSYCSLFLKHITFYHLLSCTYILIQSAVCTHCTTEHVKQIFPSTHTHHTTKHMYLLLTVRHILNYSTALPCESFTFAVLEMFKNSFAGRCCSNRAYFRNALTSSSNTQTQRGACHCVQQVITGSD